MSLVCCTKVMTTVPEDDRFAYRWPKADGPIVIAFISESNQHREVSVPDVNAAYDFMLKQARPHASLRIGDLVRYVTTAVGVKTCTACKARQLRFNKL